MKALEELGYYLEAEKNQDGEYMSRFEEIRIFQTHFGRAKQKNVRKQGIKYTKVIEDGKVKIKTEVYPIDTISKEELEAVLQVMREME